MLHHRHSSGALLGHSYALNVRRPSATQADCPPPSGPPPGPGPLSPHAAPYLHASISDSEGMYMPGFPTNCFASGGIGKAGGYLCLSRCRYWVSSLSLAGFAILNHPLAGLVAPVSLIVFQSGVAGAPSGERNFRIFYCLFAGATATATAEERQHMQLLEQTTFRYLSHCGIPGGCQNIVR
jgi:hypothetical protein